MLSCDTFRVMLDVGKLLLLFLHAWKLLALATRYFTLVILHAVSLSIYSLHVIKVMDIYRNQTEIET